MNTVTRVVGGVLVTLTYPPAVNVLVGVGELSRSRASQRARDELEEFLFQTHWPWSAMARPDLVYHREPV